MGFDEATYLAAILVLIETVVRVQWVASGNQVDSSHYYSPFAIQASLVFIVFFALSIISTALFVWRFHKWTIFKNQMVQQCLPFLYMIDSVGALILGYNLYYENIGGVIFAMILLTNFFMLHILHGVFSGKGHNDMVRFKTYLSLYRYFCMSKTSLLLFLFCTCIRQKSSPPRSSLTSTTTPLFSSWTTKKSS